MTKTTKNTVIGLVAIILVAVGGYYAFVHKTPGSGNVAPVEGAVSQTELGAATASLKGAIELANTMYGVSGAAFDFTARPTYGHFANFGIMQNVNEVKSVGLVDEMAVIFSGKTNDDYAEVDPKTNRVISFHRTPNYGFCDEPGCANRTPAQLEQMARQYVERIEPDFAEIEPTLTYETNSKTGDPKGSNFFFTWNDMNYAKQLPKGAEAERAPFIQVGITSSGFIFSYNNTIDLYRNALKEFSVTQ